MARHFKNPPPPTKRFSIGVEAIITYLINNPTKRASLLFKNNKAANLNPLLPKTPFSGRILEYLFESE